MANKRFLDLDQLVAEPGVLRFKGKEYQIPEMDVGKFIQIMHTQQSVEDGDTTGSLQVAREILMEAIPGFTEEDVNSLTVRQLTSLMQFIIDEVQMGVEEDEGENPSPSLEAVK